MERLLTFIFLLPLHSVRGQDVTQHPPSYTAEIGGTFIMDCKYDDSAFYSLLWYKQRRGKALDFVRIQRAEEDVTENRYRFQLDKKKKLSVFSITRLESEDSMTYWCAFEATSGSWGKLLFGGGTQLNVIPKTERTVPSVYKLKSSSLTESLPSSVCLITDFPSPNKTLQINGKDVDLNDMAVLDESSDNKWRYSTVTWDTNDDDNACNGKYDENDLEAEYTAENTDETCSSIFIDDTFRTNPSLNTLSLTVFGWRVFTAKAIVFNLLITLRLWSS